MVFAFDLVLQEPPRHLRRELTQQCLLFAARFQQRDKPVGKCAGGATCSLGPAPLDLASALLLERKDKPVHLRVQWAIRTGEFYARMCLTAGGRNPRRIDFQVQTLRQDDLKVSHRADAQPHLLARKRRGQLEPERPVALKVDRQCLLAVRSQRDERGGDPGFRALLSGEIP